MNTNFYSALALFQSLFKSKKGDIYTIINRFIMVSVRGLGSFTIEDIVPALKEHFQIEIPQAVIRKCISSKYYQYKNGKYYLINQYSNEINEISKELKKIDAANGSIISDFIRFVESKTLSTLPVDKKNLAITQFYDYVVDKDSISVSQEYNKYITEFIIKNEDNADFQTTFDNLKEGLIIYKGIRYSNGSNDKTWKKNTTFFLDLEYLFSSFGMNGSYYKDCFFDFYNLVKEINDGSPRKYNVPRITLRYFNKTSERMNKFFTQAERIKCGLERYVDVTDAMDYILNSCKEEKDVILFKSNFISHLNKLEIKEYEEEIDFERNKDYLLKTEDLENLIRTQFKEKADMAIDMLRYADNINILRKGHSSNDMETCKYVFLSDGNVPTKLSKLLKEYYPDSVNYLMCRMEMFTERMWFKLQKGIIQNNSMASFNVLMKAKRVVSGLLDERVSECYERIKSDTTEKDDLIGFYEELRTRQCKPEDVNMDSIDNNWLYEDLNDSLRKYQEEQSKLQQKAEMVDRVKEQIKEKNDRLRTLEDENSKIKAQLKSIENKKRSKKRIIAKCVYFPIGLFVKSMKFIFWGILLAMVALLFYDKAVGIVGGVLSFVGIILTLCPTFEKTIQRKSHRIYLHILKVL